MNLLKMHFPRRYKIEIEHLDIAPLIDVVFLLLIFFMLTSKFVVASGIKVHLPESRSKEAIKQRGLTITIDKKGDIYLGDRKGKVDFSELGQALSFLSPRGEAGSKGNKSVIIYADRQTALERVIEVWDICRESGIKEIGISAIPSD